MDPLIFSPTDILIRGSSIFSPTDILNHGSSNFQSYSGSDPGFQVRGGVHLKKIALSGGRREHFWGISCEKSRFYAKKTHIFFQF